METINDPTVQTAVHLWAVVYTYGFYVGIAAAVVMVVLALLGGALDSSERKRHRASFAKSQAQAKAAGEAYRIKTDAEQRLHAAKQRDLGSTGYWAWRASPSFQADLEAAVAAAMPKPSTEPSRYFLG